MKKFKLYSPLIDAWLPCKPGEYQLEFDIIECDIPRDIYKKIIGENDCHNNMPVGFNSRDMIVGAILMRIK